MQDEWIKKSSHSAWYIAQFETNKNKTEIKKKLTIKKKCTKCIFSLSVKKKSCSFHHVWNAKMLLFKEKKNEKQQQQQQQKRNIQKIIDILLSKYCFKIRRKKCS